MMNRVGLRAAVAAALCFGCSDDGSDGERTRTTITVSGAVSASEAPPAAKTVVLWVVTSGSPDYLFKYGEGSSTGAAFSVSLGAAPPAEAINAYGLGVGVVGLVPANVEVAEGKVTSQDLDMLGYSTRHAVIWKGASFSGDHWIAQFPEGFACGACKTVPEGEGFDSFEPASCSEVQIETASDVDTLEGCNWT